jgi:hypothetical protein
VSFGLVITHVIVKLISYVAPWNPLINIISTMQGASIGGYNDDGEDNDKVIGREDGEIGI